MANQEDIRWKQRFQNFEQSFGLKDTDLVTIRSVLQNFREIEEAVIFGSRATGTYRKGSDVDIALQGENVTIDVTQKVSYLLNEETVMPYQFDVLSYGAISNSDLVDHIQRVGGILYSANTERIVGEPAGKYLKHN